MMKIAGESTTRNLRHKFLEKIKTILHTWGEEQPGTEQAEIIKLSPERERFSVPHAARDSQILKDRNLESEDIFELI